MKVHGLTQKQKLFVKEYIKDEHQTNAARRAGFSTKSSAVAASKLMARPLVREAIAKAMARAVRQAAPPPQSPEPPPAPPLLPSEKAPPATPRDTTVEVGQTTVLDELSLIGFSDAKDFLHVTPEGRVVIRSLDELPPGASRVISELKGKQWYTGRGKDKRLVSEFSLKLHNKIAALTTIAQHLGMLVQKHVHSDPAGGPIMPGVMQIQFVDAQGQPVDK